MLIRRNISDGDLAFSQPRVRPEQPSRPWSRSKSSLGDRGRFETAKNELGLDHIETRSWHGWHRHVSLVMLAFAMMAVIRHRANAATPPKSSGLARSASDSLVDPGGAADRQQARTAPHPARSHHRMVLLATSPSGRRPTGASQI